MGIEENLKARLAAETIAELADEEARVHGRRLWEQLMKIVMSHVPMPKSVVGSRAEAMTASESKRFGQFPMPYGEFEGMKIDEVPLDRLMWYAEQTFIDDLRRYLKSQRVLYEMRYEEEN